MRGKKAVLASVLALTMLFSGMTAFAGETENLQASSVSAVQDAEEKQDNTAPAAGEAEVTAVPEKNGTAAVPET